MLKSLSLLAINGPSRGNSVSLSMGKTLLGRTGVEGGNGGTETFLDLEAFDADERISRRHARVHFTAQGAEIEDLESLNGTILNRGESLAAGLLTPLKDGDELVLGGTVFRVSLKQE